jgi:ubiquinone/menaquinone biosynthesis C-methylase UbiE
VPDVGCGRGGNLAQLITLGAQPSNLYGIDLLPDRIEDVVQQFPEMHFDCGNAEHLDFPNDHFDLVMLFTVLSSIQDQIMTQNITAEVRRVSKPGGAVLWYDFRYNNPWNPHTHGMTRRRIAELFGGFAIHLRTITVIPPLARRLGRLTDVVYPWLARIPFLRGFYLGLLVKPSDQAKRIV